MSNYNDWHGKRPQTDTNLLISVVKEGMTFGSILNQRYEIIWDVLSQNMF